MLAGMSKITQKITPFLWFERGAEDAAAFYISVFPNSKISRSFPGPNGKPMTVAFEIAGMHFTAINGGPQFKITEGISFVVACETQAEIDEYWSKLTSDGGKAAQCGWLKDKFGVSWQIVPAVLPELLKNPATAGKVMMALMGMVKLEIAGLEAAAKG